jgi:hypothetical protein
MTDSSNSLSQPDPANIGPDDLWAVWVGAPLFLRQAGTPAVSIEWMLAAPKDEGFKRLASGFGEDFITAMPLSLMRQMAQMLPPEPTSGGLPKWVQIALGADSSLILSRNSEGGTRVVSSARDLLPGEEELVRGSRRDFDNIFNEGERILQEKDWRKIFSDARPFVKQGEVGWLHHARNPEGAAAMAELIELSRNAH